MENSDLTSVFTKNEINIFLQNAPDSEYLCDKVLMIFGVYGLMADKQMKLMQDFTAEQQGENWRVVIVGSYRSRFFVKAEHEVIIDNYSHLRPANLLQKEYFIKYENNLCIDKAVSMKYINEAARRVALFLDKPNSDNFKKNAFQKTGMDIMVNSGTSLLDLAQIGGWKTPNSSDYLVHN